MLKKEINIALLFCWCIICEVGWLLQSHPSLVESTLLVSGPAMESSEKWCDLTDDCDLPISNGLLGELAITQPPTLDPMPRLPYSLRSVDVLASPELNLTNSTCHYPFCVALLSFTIKNTKYVTLHYE